MAFDGTERFVLRQTLGRGGMGVVYEAYDNERQASVALKTVSDINPASLYRFKREFRALADVRHPNLVSLYELASTDGQWFFSMELLQGVDFITWVRGAEFAKAQAKAQHSRLTEELANATLDTLTSFSTDVSVSGSSVDGGPLRDVPLDTARLRAALPQLIDGILALHSSGHLHRDIKPTNILVSPEGRVVLLDFGVIMELSKRGARTEESFTGTPAYMAPEQADNASTVTEACDWYSVGVLLYEALAGRRPYLGSALQVLRAKRDGLPEDPRAYQPGAPADLCVLCMRLLTPSPIERPSGIELLDLFPASATRAVSEHSPVAVAVDPTFIGRDTELGALRAAYDRTRGGAGAVVYVHGVSGMGKSALIRRFLDEVAADPEAVLLEGRCYQRESVPYKALDSVVDSLCQFLLGLPVREVEQLMPRGVAMLSRVFPVLNRLEAVARNRHQAAGALDPHEVRRRAFQALRDMFGRLAERRSVVVFIDDLQWGDVDSVPLLDVLTRPPDEPGMLLLASYRSEERQRSGLLRALFRRESRLGPSSTAQQLAIGPLAEQDAVQLATALAAGRELAIEPVQIAREADGHPYFIHELVRHASVPSSGERDALTLDGVIWHRVQPLPAEARRLLAIIAVIGRPVSQRVIQQAAVLDPGARIELLRQLQDEYLVQSSGTRDTDPVECYHDRIRETVISHLSAEELQQHHLALAFALQSAETLDADALAVHFRAAGQDEAAAVYTVMAADQAAEALAFDRAAELYRASLELAEAGATDQVHALRIKLADALANAGRGGEAGEAYLAAVDASHSAEVRELQRQAALQFLRAGHIDRGVEVITQVLATMGMSLAKTPRGALASLLLRRSQLRLRGLRFKPRSVTSIPADELSRIDTCWAVSLGLAMTDTYRAADFQTRNLLLALRSGERFRIARALAIELGFASLQGIKTRKRSLKLVALSAELAEQEGDLYLYAWAQGGSSIVDYQVGKFGSARSKATAAIDTWREKCAGVAWEIASAELYRLWSLFYLGELRELSERVRSLLEEARSLGDLYTAASVRTGLPNFAWLMADDPDEAARELRDALEKWSHKGFHLQHYWGHVSRTHNFLYAGDIPSAYAEAGTVVAKVKRAMMMSIQSVRVEVLHLRARCAVAMAGAEVQSGGSPELHLREVDSIVRKLDREGIPWGEAFAQLLRASVSTLRDEPEVAAQAHAKAAAIAAQAELGLYAAAARRRHGELLGGEQGAGLVQDADRWMTDQMVVNPAQITGILVP